MLSRSISIFLTAAVLLAAAISGLFKLRLETDILDVLPRNLPSVNALKSSQEHFSNDQQVILLLESNAEEIYEEDAEALAKYLRSELPGAKILFKSEFEENTELFAESLTSIWRHAPPEALSKLRENIENPEAHLEDVKSRIRASFDQQDSTMAAYDPLGFLDHPAIAELTESGLSFQSEDGMRQLILIESNEPTSDYNKHREWIEKIRHAVNAWPELKELDLEFRITGSPAFNAEIGSAMEGDMSGTLSITFTLIALVFLLVQRQPLQLLLLGGLLSLTFIITLGIGGWIFGTLNLVSVGFAAILLGLVIDYGVVIMRESDSSSRSASELRGKLFKAIFWAALTTAAVFGLLMLSTFNGVQQFGGLIVIGLISGSTIMLIFVPIFLQRFPTKPAKSFTTPPFFGRTVAIGVLAFFIIASLSSLLWKGLPQVDFDFAMVEPESSEAAAAFETIQGEFPAWSEKTLQMVAQADDWNALIDLAKKNQATLSQLKKDGAITQFNWPLHFIPDEAAFTKNREAIAAIVSQKDQVKQQLLDAGFTESGIALDMLIFEKLAEPVEKASISPLAKNFLVKTAGGKVLLSGTVFSAAPATSENLAVFDDLNKPEAALTGWAIIQARLLPSVKRDFQLIFLPATGALLLLLFVVFRSVKDSLITAAVLITALLLVNAFIVLTGSSWNFLNGMAIPLIVGTGIDYSIHLIFSLRRSNGDFKVVWNSVGKAICFCGFSTSIGFGSLLFASNEILQSMGRLCGIGVLFTTLLSVFVIPGLWKRIGR